MLIDFNCIALGSACDIFTIRLSIRVLLQGSDRPVVRLGIARGTKRLEQDLSPWIKSVYD